MCDRTVKENCGQIARNTSESQIAARDKKNSDTTGANIAREKKHKQTP
jgi:hypothetical protein